MRPLLNGLYGLSCFKPPRRASTEWSARILYVAAFLAPILPVFLLKSMAPIFIATGILAGIAWCVENKRLPVNNAMFTALLGAFLLWCGLSITWSINAQESTEKFLKLLLFFIPLWTLTGILPYFTKVQCLRVVRYLTFGLVAGVLLYLFESVSGFLVFYSLYDGVKTYDAIQNKTLYMFFLMMVPAVYYCWTRREEKYFILAGGFLLIAVPVLIWASSNKSMQTVLQLMAMGAIALFLLPLMLTRKVILALMLITCLTAPFFAQSLRQVDGIMEMDLANTFKSRVEIWDMTARRAMEKPLFGWGIKSSPYMPNRGEMSVLYMEPTEISHLHPHNGVLQIWFELGLVGIILLMGVIMYLMRSIERIRHRGVQSVVLFVMTTGFLYILPSFGIWQTWFMATLAMAACIMICMVRAYDDRALSTKEKGGKITSSQGFAPFVTRKRAVALRANSPQSAPSGD